MSDKEFSLAERWAQIGCPGSRGPRLYRRPFDCGGRGIRGLPEEREAGRRPASNRLQEFAYIGKRWLASEGTAEWGAADDS
jgi:hypothetical protein